MDFSEKNEGLNTIKDLRTREFAATVFRVLDTHKRQDECSYIAYRPYDLTEGEEDESGIGHWKGNAYFIALHDAEDIKDMTPIDQCHFYSIGELLVILEKWKQLSALVCHFHIDYRKLYKLMSFSVDEKPDRVKRDVILTEVQDYLAKHFNPEMEESKW